MRTVLPPGEGAISPSACRPVVLHGKATHSDTVSPRAVYPLVSNLKTGTLRKAAAALQAFGVAGFPHLPALHCMVDGISVAATHAPRL